MAHVAVLPDALANQIAAGEVVERPASVVKELVENALDADATTVFVDVEEGGRQLVRVVDDGLGMAREDAILALQRHATSKIRHVEDLRAIATLGFRGEALPSIASVSRFRLVTRTADDPVGTEVTVDGGAPPVVRDAGGPVGTRIEVRDLFHNVPARLKFLKRTATEMAHVTSLLTATALGFPHVHVRLTHNGRVRLDHPVAPSLKQRIFQVLGRKTTEHLVEVRLDGPIRVRGFVSDPGHHRANQQGIHTFVNGRHVRDRTVTHALVSAYGGLMERGRYPWAVLYVHLPPEEVDVNVHPAKAEVRFVSAGQVHEAIVRACRVTLSASPWRERVPASYDATPRERRGLGLIGESQPTPLPMDRYGLSARREAARRPLPPEAWSPDGASDARPPAAGPGHAKQLVIRDERPSDLTALGPASVSGWAGRRRLGVAAGRFLLCEGGDALYAVDLAAAHQWLVRTRLLAPGPAPRRPLLIPLQLELSPRHHDALEAHGEPLAALGFGLEPFGGRTWQAVGVPDALGAADVGAVVAAALDALAGAGARGATDALVDAIAAEAWPRGEALASDAALDALLVALDGHGAPPRDAPFATEVPLSALDRAR